MKSGVNGNVDAGTIVAPFTGAWIEIVYWVGSHHGSAAVAPFTGAWIEIVGRGSPGSCPAGRTLHGCVD